MACKAFINTIICILFIFRAQLCTAEEATVDKLSLSVGVDLISADIKILEPLVFNLTLENTGNIDYKGFATSWSAPGLISAEIRHSNSRKWISVAIPELLYSPPLAIYAYLGGKLLLPARKSVVKQFHIIGYAQNKYIFSLPGEYFLRITYYPNVALRKAKTHEPNIAPITSPEVKFIVYSYTGENLRAFQWIIENESHKYFVPFIYQQNITIPPPKADLFLSEFGGSDFAPWIRLALARYYLMRSLGEFSIEKSEQVISTLDEKSAHIFIGQEKKKLLKVIKRLKARAK